MKHRSLNICAALAAIIITFNSTAQVYTNEQAALKVPGAQVVKVNELRKTIDFVKPASINRISVDNSMAWLTQQVLKTKPDVSFTLNKSEKDNVGGVHYRYNELYKQLPVEYGVYNIHSKDGYVQSANGEYYSGIEIAATPALTKDAAFQKALQAVPSNHYKVNSKTGLTEMKDAGTLLILPVNSDYLLAYKFDIYSLSPLKRVYIYIDANTGKVIKEINRIETTDSHGTATTAYSGTVTMTTDSINANSFRLYADKGFSGIHTMNLNTGTDYTVATEFTDADNIWNATNIDQYAYDAHFGSEATYDFYMQRFARNSYDNAGASINAYVHYSTGYVNAFWDGTEMTYGDGDGAGNYPLTSLDIVGHEITHAVTEHTAGLIYSDESGALNESFSDCFGVTIDYFKNPTTANFLEGDQINVNGIPFRNMGNPNQYSNPDTYNGTYWNAPNEVHNNSGVQNYWYYLLCMGGSGTNDLGDVYTINPIGMDDASAIAFRSLTVYLTPNSQYADARFYSIQAADDLFGSCSNQVIQVTNAWYAVGVDSVFSNAVIAGFNASQDVFCVVPAIVNFNNASLNATSYLWDFGDGFTSTSPSPSHTYTSAGTYTVKLIASGVGTCSSVDTLTMTNYINLTNGGGPLSASCTPVAVSVCCGIGISNVLFGSINHASSDASEGYKDFTCGNSTTLIAGDPIPINITTGTTNNENVKVWIDYDNNGVFNNATELAYTSSNHFLNHLGVVNTSASAVLNTPLRMRVMDDNATNAITAACNNPQNGQAEDYTVTFVANTQPPVADFTADATTVSVGGTVNFTDLTQHAPTGWTWTFTGGTPLTSSVQNPSVVYSTLGTYTVKLAVTNFYGQDSITKVAYINVVNTFNMCSGTTFTSIASGQLCDSGGPTVGYQDNESCTLLIDPGCASSITLLFAQFNVEGGWDFFKVYDGANASAPLLLSATGGIIPSNVTATSGKMFISWSSDVSVHYDGWVANWTSVAGTVNPPLPASCTPQTLSNCCGIGVTQVVFNSINHSSADGSEGYQDNSCTNITTVTAGQTYPISITVGLAYAENVKAWIDYNNDGMFDTITEQVFSAVNATGVQAANITIPLSAVINTTLRMRIGDEYVLNSGPSPCVDAPYGQFEDYAVVVNSPVGITEPTDINSLIMFPNPFSDELIISYQLSESHHVSLQVLDVLGQLIQTVEPGMIQQAGKYKYKFNPENAGVYFIQMSVDGKVSTYKSVKVD